MRINFDNRFFNYRLTCLVLGLFCNVFRLCCLLTCACQLILENNNDDDHGDNDVADKEH